MLGLAVNCNADHVADKISKQFRTAERNSQYDYCDCENHNSNRKKFLLPKRNLIVVTTNDNNIRLVRVSHGIHLLVIFWPPSAAGGTPIPQITKEIAALFRFFAPTQT